MSNQETVYNTENVSVKVEREKGSLVKMHISVSQKGTEAAYQKALKNINKEVSLPGFRKGKAPTSLIAQNYATHVDQEWHDVLINTAFSEALDLVKIYPLKKESIKKPQIKNISKEDGASLIIEFEAEPEVPEVNPVDLTLKPVKLQTITQKDIDQVIHDIQLYHAVWEDVTDRPIQEGDFVELDIDSLDEPFDNICKNTQFEVADGKMGAWMRKLLEGHSAGEVVTGLSEKDPEAPCNECTSEGDEEHHHQHHHQEFKPTNLKITIHKVKKAILPELNDELAGKTGVKTVDELLIKVKEDLEKQAETQVKNLKRRQIEEQLLKLYPFDIPASLGKEEKKYRVDYQLSHLKPLEGQDVAAIKQSIKEDISNKVDNAYRLFFITRKIAEDHQIEVTSEEIMREFMHQMMIQDSEEAIVHSKMEPQEIRARLQSYLQSNKVKDFLIESAELGKKNNP